MKNKIFVKGGNKKKMQQTLQQEVQRRKDEQIKKEAKATRHRLRSDGGAAGGDICRRGVNRLVNRGFGYSWTYSPHLRPECTRLAFQTLSPVTRGRAAARERTAPHLHLTALRSSNDKPVLGSCAGSEKTKISPVGGLQPLTAIIPIAPLLLTGLRSVTLLW